MPEAATAVTAEPATWDFRLPSLGADMDVGVLLEWSVEPGDTVERGSIVALVSTEKADIDVEIWREGEVVELLVDLDTEIEVGTPILRLVPSGDAPTPEPDTGSEPGQATEPGPKPVPAEAPTTGPPPAPAVPRPTPTRLPGPPGGDRLPASPLARARAAERDIELSSIVGTGPDGAVLLRDVEAARPAPSPSRRAKGARERPEEAMRRAIASRMAKANAEIPHYFLDQDVDLGPALDRLAAHNENLSVSERVLPAVLLLRATARAAVAVPDLNGYWDDDRFEPAGGSDLAVAVSLRRGGLVTPVITGVADRSIDDLMAVLREMVTAARSGTLRSSWMGQAGLTVTNLGDRGVDRVGGVIFPPQVALVGFGRIRQRPWVIDDVVVPRPIVTASLAADHRASDGATGSRFLTALAKDLENPELP